MTSKPTTPGHLTPTITLAYRLAKVFEAAPRPRGHEKLYSDSVTRLTTLLATTVERMYPDAYVMLTQWYTNGDEWLSVNIEWRCNGPQASEVDAMPTQADIRGMMTTIYAACEKIRDDTASWLVTTPYSIETCGECGNDIEPDQRYVHLVFFSPAYGSLSGRGGSGVYDVYIHEGCRARLIDHFTNDLSVAKQDRKERINDDE